MYAGTYHNLLRSLYLFFYLEINVQKEWSLKYGLLGTQHTDLQTLWNGVAFRFFTGDNGFGLNR